MRETSIVKYQEYLNAIIKSDDITELKDIRDKAEATRNYAQKIGESLENQNLFAEIKIRCERRVGELLKGMEFDKGGTPYPDVRGLTLAKLGISYNQSHRWQKEAKVSEEDLNNWIANLKENEREITSTAFFRYANLEGGTKTKTPPLPDNKFRTIVIDPPWPMKKIIRDTVPKQGLHLDYPTMTIDEIKALEIEKIADEHCHIYLWTTHKFLPASFDILRTWGFKYQCLLTWIKNVGFTPFSWMYSTEHVLFGRKGNLDLLVKGKRLDFTGKRREHSRKPDEFYNLVKQVSPAPRIDCYSREQREGFEQYGNETEKFKRQNV